MTAVSPYAPGRRNSYLRQSSISSLQTTTSLSVASSRNTTTAVFAFFIFVARFWNQVASTERVQKFLQRRPKVLSVINWVLNFFGAQPIHPQPISELRIENNQNNGSNDGGNIRTKRTNSEYSAPAQRISLFSISDHLLEDDMTLDFQQQNQNQLLIFPTVLRRIKENKDLIHDVMMYWFGQYPPETSQKMLWMIANSSHQLRARVDKEISDKFEALLLELSSSSSSSSTDMSSERWNEWCFDVDGIYGYRGKVAAIIVLDQFSRHIQRHHTSSTGGTSSSSSSNLPPKEILDGLAYKTAKLFVETHLDEIKSGMVPLPMYVFSLMPYRHASTIESVAFVQSCVEEYADMNGQMEAMLGRFRKATNRRMAVLQDEARRKGTATSQVTADGDDTKKNAKTNNDKDTTGRFTDEDILETFPFEADLSVALNHPVHKTITSFLTDRGIHASRDVNNKPSPLSAVIVSLSGGVDSMVIASVLSHLNKSCGYNLHITAVHIDYANRPESHAEADFVQRYCCDTLGIEFRCRKIDEVTRGVTSRDDYERISREVRYTSYREAIAAVLPLLDENGNHNQSKIENIGVMLGHHLGDLRENVLSNAHKGCGPLDLSGMTSVSKNDGVTIHRPLLPLEKSFILDYAHKFGVPYFKDTTPHWSTRGKLRNKLLPLLQEIYGDGSMRNLSNLAQDSDECRALLYESVIGPFLERIVRKPMGIIMETSPWKDQPIFFWKFVLREALHSASLGMFSDKSVISFLERIQVPANKKLRSGWLQCRKDYAVYLQEDGKVLVFYPTSFPFQKKDLYNDILGQTLNFDEIKSIGPWDVKANIVNDKCETFRLAQRAIPSMEELMDGQIEYYIESPTWQVGKIFEPRRLVFCHFSKSVRPIAWKNSDLKVQTTLPIVGNDDVANTAMDDLWGHGLVHMEDGKETLNPKSLIRVSISLRTTT